MAVADEIALAMAEHDILLRRNHLRAVADELAERSEWLDQWLPSGQLTPLPPNDWMESVEQERKELAAAREALLVRRKAQVQAQEAALLLWQMQLDTMTAAVRSRERAHRQPLATPRASLNRHVEAPELSLKTRKPPRTQGDEWQVPLDLPTAEGEAQNADISRGRTVTMTPEDAAATEPLSRANKRRTARMNPVMLPSAADAPDTSPTDLPTMAPAPAAPPSRHRGRTMTEPFLAALDLDGLYLQRRQVAVDLTERAVRVWVGDEARHADATDMPAHPAFFTYRSREGDTRVFGLREVELRSDAGGHWLVLDVQHWPHEDLQAFHRALTTLP
jgi:hypothetical protein